MKAEEMFKELGYGKVIRKHINKKEYLNYENAEDIYMEFNLTYKVVEMSDDYEVYTLDIPTLKAIIKQCEELGWLE